jgi:hypothetical protein
MGGGRAVRGRPCADSGRGDEWQMYGQQEIDRMLAQLCEDWPDDRLREMGVLAPYLEEKLAATRTEALRQGYLADRRVDDD